MPRPPMLRPLMQDSALPLMEVVPTIQGEGFHQGKAACFIRLGGCDVGCHWCDTKESWSLEGHTRMSVSEIVDKVAQGGIARSIVTGGEPLMHDLEGLSAALRAAHIAVHLETSGAYPLTGTWDWICLSPKKPRPPHPSVLAQAHELKCVVYNRDDFLWAERYASQCPQALCFLQPEWSVRKRILPEVLEYMAKHPHWSLSLQTHKYMCIP